MLSHKRILIAVASAFIVFGWVVVATATSTAFLGLVRFMWIAALLSIAVAWLFFTFAGRLFTWPRAFRSVIAGTLVVTPLLAYYFAESRDQTLTEKFLFVIGVAWAATFGGTLWNLGAATGDALREWREARHVGRRHPTHATA